MDWRSSTRGLSQIWLEVREKSRNIFKPCYVVTTCKNQWFKYGELTFFFSFGSPSGKISLQEKNTPLGPGETSRAALVAATKTSFSSKLGPGTGGYNLEQNSNWINPHPSPQMHGFLLFCFGWVLGFANDRRFLF